MVEAQDEQEAAGGHHRTEDAGRWWQGGAGGGARGLGGMDRTNSGGHRGIGIGIFNDNVDENQSTTNHHRVEEGGQGTMEGEGASSSETGMEQGLGARQGV